MTYKLPIKGFDFFSGCGGASRGFKDADIDVVCAIDNNEYATKTFKKNFLGSTVYESLEFSPQLSQVTFLSKSIEEISPEALQPIVDRCTGHPILFAGCAPCQPFTQQQTKHPDEDSRKGLLEYFRKFVNFYQPEFVFVENVPGMQKVSVKDGGPFDNFVKTLGELEYSYKYDIVHAQDYGVPQKRKRLVLIASKLGKIDFPPKTHGPGTTHVKYSTPREYMDGFPHLNAGEADKNDTNHQAGNLSEMNLRRIKATPIGGDRLDWPEELWLECHKNGYRGHSDVYGRIKWDELSNCLTTKCTSLSNGRFGHPEQHRPITPREAACLQTFPRDFIFEGGVSVAARQIGNAVPVLLAQRFGEHFNNHLKAYIAGELNG